MSGPDHGEEHFETDRGVNGVWLIGGEQHGLSGLYSNELRRDSKFAFSFQNVGQSVESGSMFAECLAFIECKERDGACGPLQECAAYNGSLLVVYETRQIR